MLLSGFDVWGPGSDDERLLTAWLEFKAWCRRHKWQLFSCKCVLIRFGVHGHETGPVVVTRAV